MNCKISSPPSAKKVRVQAHTQKSSSQIGQRRKLNNNNNLSSDRSSYLDAAFYSFKQEVSHQILTTLFVTDRSGVKMTTPQNVTESAQMNK